MIIRPNRPTIEIDREIRVDVTPFQRAHGHRPGNAEDRDLRFVIVGGEHHVRMTYSGRYRQMLNDVLSRATCYKATSVVVQA